MNCSSRRAFAGRDMLSKLASRTAQMRPWRLGRVADQSTAYGVAVERVRAMLLGALCTILTCTSDT